VYHSWAEIRLEFPNRKVGVTLLDRNHYGLPDAIQISVTDSHGKKTDLEVTAIAPASLGGDLGPRRQYEGSIPAGIDSYVGASIKFPLKKSKIQPNLTKGVH
jgi:hypothetical protein